MTHSITWPAIIKLSNQDELIYIQDEIQWNHDRHLHEFAYRPHDMLIDSRGAIYLLSRAINSRIKPEPTGHTLELSKIVEMVRAHVAQDGQCCISKWATSSIAEAIRTVGSLET